MKLKIALLLLIIQSVFAQPQLPKNIIYTETNLLPKDSIFSLNISFKIPYNNLVFEKNNEFYTADFSYWVEVLDSNSSFINRQIKDYQIKTLTFEETNKKQNYFEGLEKFDINPGSYQIIPIFTDKNAGREIKLPPQNFQTSSFDNDKYLPPIVIKSNLINCNNSDLNVLANFEGHIPFSEESYDLLLPVKTEADQIFLTVMNNKDTVFRDAVSDKYISGLEISDCDGNIVIKNEGNKYHDFILKEVNKKLIEGSLIVYVSDSADSKEKKRFNMVVRWFNKPVSLSNPEFAIKAIKFIDSEEIVDDLLSSKEEKYNKVLLDYWLKYDPDPFTTYNPLMLEYYNRVDYALRTFSTITGKSGLETDRGKIYVQLGKPSKIERTSDDYGKIVETWIYQKQQKTFVFTDKRGTGNFSLKES